MASDPGRGAFVRVACSAAALALLGFIAGRAYPSPHALVSCGLGGLIGFVLLWRAVQQLHAASRPRMEEIAPIAPQNELALQERLARLEATLEHAPIALFSMGGDLPLSPMNAYGRRLIAPGRVIDVAAFYATFTTLQAGRRNLITYDTERGQERALVAISDVAILGMPRCFAALMTVESELESAALQAWQQLVHVLTHEIMNSLTPVASLSQTARDLLEEWRNEPAGGADADLATALSAIARRANSLVQFVASYRSLSNIPPARIERLRLSDLFARLSALTTPDWSSRDGNARFKLEPTSLELMIDAGQLEQALINLLQNAAEATGQVIHPEVAVSARLGRGGRLLIEVQDNGPGVAEHLIEHIFTPFFSTKPKGGGIGLAMVRQLVHGNGGTVRYVKPVGGGARFVLTF